MNSFISNISICLNKSNTPSYKTNGLLFCFLTLFPSVILSRITRKTSNDPHVSEIDNKADCSLDNIDNSDEEVELPNDILEALERQDEGSKPNIEELEIINLAEEGEEPKEVKIGTRFTMNKRRHSSHC
jgi:hypothetical protein